MKININMNSLKRFIVLSIVVCLISTSFWIAPAAAESSRVAIIDKVVGDVFVTKSGGSREFQAYESMALNQGDLLRTESSSSVELRVEDREDILTIDENTELAVSKLAESEGGKQSKFKMWAGSIFSKVKSLFGSEDEFTVETPNATMGVRGTNFTLAIDPETGGINLNAFSGVVTANIPPSPFTPAPQGTPGNFPPPSNVITVYPSQQLDIFVDTDSAAPPSSTLSFTDPAEFIEKAGPEIIKSLLKAKSQIDQENSENQENIQQGMKEQGLLDPVIDEDELNKLKNNLDNLVGNVIKKAVDKKIVNDDEVNEIIEDINQQNPNEKFDLNEVQELQEIESEAAKKAKQKLEQLRQLQKQKQEEELKRRQEQQEQMQQLLDKLQDQLQKQKEANEQAKQQEQKEAKEKLLKQLSEEQQQRFEEAQKLREEQLKRAQEAQEKRRQQQEEQAENGAQEEEVVDEQEEDEPAEEPTVTDIAALADAEVSLGASYTLPARVSAQMSNNTSRQVAVTWNPATVDTSVTGETVYTGKVAGFSGSIELTVRVLAPLAEAIELDSQTEVLDFEHFSLDLSEAQLPEGVTLTVSKDAEAKAEAEDAGMTTAGEVLSFEFSEEVSGQPVQLKFELMEGVDADNVGVFYQSEEVEGIWQYMPTERDGDTVSTTVSHFSTYGVFVAEKASVPTVVPLPEQAGDKLVNIYYNEMLPAGWTDFSAGMYQINGGEWIYFHPLEGAEVTIPAEGLNLKVKGIQPNRMDSEVMEYHYELPFASLSVVEGTAVSGETEDTYLVSEQGLELQVKLHNVKDIYGLELHLAYDGNIKLDDYTTSEGIFGGANGGAPIERVDESGDMYQKNLLYVMLNDETLSEMKDIEGDAVILTVTLVPVLTEGEMALNGIEISEAFVLDNQNNRTDLFTGDAVMYTAPSLPAVN